MSRLAEYAQLKTQIKELTAKAKALEPLVHEEVMAVDGEKVETNYGTFSIFTKTVWAYSQELEDKEKLIKEKIKLMKKEEELSGKATKDAVKSILRFQGK